MTWAEAEARADRIWPDVASVWRSSSGPVVWIVNTASGIRRAVVHSMDETGRPTCHSDCIARADDRDARP